MENTENTTGSTPDNMPSDQSRPFGFWITAVDRLLAAEFATAFEDEGITRRDWRILNILDGTVPGGPQLPDRRLRHLADLGWIERTDDGWALTADGAAAKARLSTAVEEIRAQVAGALEPEEFAAMAASLEKIARGLGYEEGKRLPRRHTAERRQGHRRHGHDDHRGHGRFGGHPERPEFDRFGDRHGQDRSGGRHGQDRSGGRHGHGRFGEHPGDGERAAFDREWHRREHLRHEHRHGGHGDEQPLRGHGSGERPHGMRTRCGHNAPAHIHVHLHESRRHHG